MLPEALCRLRPGAHPKVVAVAPPGTDRVSLRPQSEAVEIATIPTSRPRRPHESFLMPAFPFDQCQQLLLSDPGERGVRRLFFEACKHNPDLSGSLKTAVEKTLLVAGASRSSERPVAVLVTGFCITGAQPPAAETDGPPGTLALAEVLGELGFQPVLVSDTYGIPSLQIGCRFCELPAETISEFPWEGMPQQDPQNFVGNVSSPTSDHWVREFFSGEIGSRTRLLIAVERPGPSHTPHSATIGTPRLESGVLAGSGVDERPESFATLVPPEHQNVCHNSRGDIIEAVTAKTHRLFELADQCLPGQVQQIAVADGGNELGCAALSPSWALLEKCLPRLPGGLSPARIACRVPACLILAGTSNWGAYALAAALATVAGRPAALARITPTREAELLRQLVKKAGAVDGRTATPVPTVDGIAQQPYFELLRQIRQMAGLGS